MLRSQWAGGSCHGRPATVDGPPSAASNRLDRRPSSFTMRSTPLFSMPVAQGQTTHGG